MNTRNKEKIDTADNTIKRKGRGNGAKVTDKPDQTPNKTNKKDIAQSPNSKSEHLQCISKLTDQSGIDDKNSNDNDVVIMDQNYSCASEDVLDALSETNFLRPLTKEICNTESASKQRFYLRTSVVEKIDKRTTSQWDPSAREELCCADGIGLNEIFKKQKLETYSSKTSAEFVATECTSDVEFYEMQQSDVMPRTDSPSSFSSDSAGFSSRIPKFKDDFGLSIIQNQSPCKRGGNISSPPRCKLKRYSSGSSYSSEMSSSSLKNQSKSSPSVCDKWLWHKNKQFSESSCMHNDNQLKQMEKQPCMSVLFTGTENVPVPSEAETAPHNPRGEILYGDIVSKIQQKFSEEKRTVNCHWLTPDDFHVNAVSVLEQNIEEDFNCLKDPCKTVSLKEYEKLDDSSPSSGGIENIPIEKPSLSPNKKKVKRSQTALLHASLKEISWAKNLNPENMLTTERRPQQRKLRDSTKKKTEDGVQALKRKELIKKPRRNKQVSNNVPKNVGNLKKGPSHSSKTVRKGTALLGSTKANKKCSSQYPMLYPQKVSQNLKSKEIVKKYMKKSDKAPFKSKVFEGKHKKSMKNEKIMSQQGKKQTTNNLSKLGKTKLCPKSNNPTLKQLPLNSTCAKHKSDSSAGKSLPLKNSCVAVPKHKIVKPIPPTDQAPELRVTLKPLDDINIWKIKKKSEEIKRRHCHYTSKSYKLTTSKGELKAQVFHKMKTSWNKITPEQKQFFSDSSKSCPSFGSVKRSTTTFSTFRTSKRKRYDEETTRYSIRQSECAFRYKEIAVKKHHNFIQIILVPNRSRQNSLTVEGMKELREALFAACKDPGCRAVLFNSSGSIFCSGIDLSPIIGCTKKVVVEELANSVRDLVQTVGSFPKPLVAAVNGMAVGFGVTLLTFCDIVLASDKATFFMPYAKLGYIAEGAATLTLPQVIGATMATDMLLRGRKLTAQEALRCGLVSEVLWPTHLMEEAVPRMQALAAQSLPVMEATKSMIRYHLWEKLQTTLEDECRSLPKQWISSICQQAIRNAMENNILME